MLKKALQGAISATMWLSGIKVDTPIVLNAQENKAKSTQTQNVLSLESRIPKVVIENNGGDNFLRLATVQGQILHSVPMLLLPIQMNNNPLLWYLEYEVTIQMIH